MLLVINMGTFLIYIFFNIKFPHKTEGFVWRLVINSGQLWS